MADVTKRVLITDLDDTLWNWLDIWYSAFYPMFQEILRVTGETEATLISVIKSIHERRGTSEYTFLIQEIEQSFGRQSDFETIRHKYGAAFHAFRKGRKEAQKLLPGVSSTLSYIKASGAKIVGYTESQAYATVQRLKAFELDGVFDLVYSPKDHDYPRDVDLDQIRSLEESHYSLQKTVHRHTPPGELKPNPRVLQSIITNMGASNAECVYVGDKLVKDVKMARDAGVLDVWAKYGNNIDSEEYVFLKRVTHWPPAAVSIEANTKASTQVATQVDQCDIPVTITLHNSFAELLDHVRFEPFSTKA